MIRLTGYIDVPPDRRGAVRAALPEHVRLTLAEPGCLSFNVVPDADIDGRYVVHETFASRADFYAHQDRMSGSDWGRITDGIARDYTVEEVPG